MERREEFINFANELAYIAILAMFFWFCFNYWELNMFYTWMYTVSISILIKIKQIMAS